MAENKQADKVKFGVSNVHYAMMETMDPPVYGVPVAIPGAVNLSLQANGGSNPFYADNMQYFVTVTNNGYSVDLEAALFPKRFMEDVFGNKESTVDKVVTENAKIQPKPFALLFQEEGDQTGTKFVLYNCTATRPSRTLATTTDTTTPQTQTSTISASPLTDGRTMSYTTENTPAEVTAGWYEKVWLKDAEGEAESGNTQGEQVEA